MSRPFKKAGFAQSLRANSSTKNERLGTLRITQDGRKYRYARNGAVALAVGKLQESPDYAAAVVNEAMPAAVAVGAKTTGFTAASAVTYTQDYFAEGQLQINDAAGKGYAYDINGSTAVTAGTAITISLDEGIRVALTTSSEGTLCHSPWQGLILQATPANANCVGWTIGAPAISDYHWEQTGGLGIALGMGTEAVGTMMVAGSTDGAVVAITSGLTITLPILAIMWATANISGEYKPMYFLID